MAIKTGNIRLFILVWLVQLGRTQGLEKQKEGDETVVFQIVANHLTLMAELNKFCFLHIFTLKSHQQLVNYPTLPVHNALIPSQLTPPNFIPPPKNVERGLILKAHHQARLNSTGNVDRHHGTCETNLYFQSEIPPDFDEFTRFGDNPNNDVFFFVGPREGLKRLMVHNSVEKLKWKVGIVMDGISGKVLVEPLPHARGHLWEIWPSELQRGYGVEMTLDGAHLHTVTIKIEQYVAYFGTDKPSMGTFYKLLKAAADNYNFTFDIEVNEGRIIPFQNGSWGRGAIAEVMTDAKDLIVGFAMAFERTHVLDWTSYHGYVGVTFYTSQPRVGVRMTAIAYPFSPGVWLMFILGLSAFIPVLFGGLHFHHPKSKTLLQKWSDAFLIPFGIVLGQSYEFRRPHKAKFPFVLLLCFSIVMVTGYQSNLLAFLTFPETEHVPLTLDELAAAPDYTIYYLSFDDAGVHFFKTSPLPTIQNIRRRIQWTKDRIKCLEKSALDPKTVCISWTTAAWSVIKRNLTLSYTKPSVIQAQDYAMHFPASFAFGKSYKFYDELNQIVNRLRDGGHYDKWFEEIHDCQQLHGNRWLREELRNTERFRKLKEITRTELPVKALNIRNVLVPFVILVGSFVLASVALLAEVVLAVCWQGIFPNSVRASNAVNLAASEGDQNGIETNAKNIFEAKFATNLTTKPLPQEQDVEEG